MEEHDAETIRCPKLGDFVPFKFCRTSGNPFCSHIIGCWAARMDIGAFLADNYAPETIQKALSTGGGRLKRMLEAAAESRGPGEGG